MTKYPTDRVKYEARRMADAMLCSHGLKNALRISMQVRRELKKEKERRKVK